MYSIFIQLITWRASFFGRGDEYPSTLVSGLPATAPPLGFCPSHPFTSHSSNYIIYIDINNLGHPHPRQVEWSDAVAIMEYNQKGA